MVWKGYVMATNSIRSYVGSVCPEDLIVAVQTNHSSHTQCYKSNNLVKYNYSSNGKAPY